MASAEGAREQSAIAFPTFVINSGFAPSFSLNPTVETIIMLVNS
jgi:hypothetical protein